MLFKSVFYPPHGRKEAASDLVVKNRNLKRVIKVQKMP